MVDYKVFLQDENGTTVTANLAWLKSELGINALAYYKDVLFRRVNALEEELITVYEEEMRTRILAIVKETPDIKTRELHAKSPNNRYKWLAWQNAFEKLEVSGEIVGVSHGRGHNRTWRLSGDDTA